MPLRRAMFLALGILALLLFLSAAYLAYQQWQAYQEQRAIYPPGSQVAGIPIGGLDRQSALQRLESAYLLPVELQYGGAAIQLAPAEAGFALDTGRMLPDPGSGESRDELWAGFWDYLWDRPASPIQTELQAGYAQDRLRAYLEGEIAARYDQPATTAGPVPGTLQFRPGEPGTRLDVNAALPLIEAALFSRTGRQVDLPIQSSSPRPPAWKNLEILLRQAVAASGFDGITDLYLIDLAEEREIHFATRQGQELSTTPDVAFTASSIIKIPILISVFRRLEQAPDEATDTLIKLMFSKSSNEAADALMKSVLDEVRGPLMVSEDLQALGYENTFLAGYFSLGSPLLQIFDTPANGRSDVDTSPDLYNQTTPSDMAWLLQDIYRCAETGSAKLLETFPGEITQAECVQMAQYLQEDREPYLIKAGVPEGTPVGHKHGYGSANNTIFTIGDAAIVYTPGGNYVLVVFVHHPQLLLWDQGNGLIVQLSRAVYNFFNLPDQPSVQAHSY